MSHTSYAPFVVIEGLDGAGTTTQAALLYERITARGVDAVLTAEPTKGPVGRLLREWLAGAQDLDPSTVTLLFSADRADHIADVIGPALKKKRTVICDRYLLSTLAYQGASGVDTDWILSMSAGFTRPTVTVFLDIEESERRRRLAARGEPAERFDDPEAASPLRAAYSSAIDLLRERGETIIEVDGSASVEVVADEILAAIDFRVA